MIFIASFLSDHGTSDHGTPNLVWPIAHNQFMCKIHGRIERVMSGSRGETGGQDPHPRDVAFYSWCGRNLVPNA